MSGGGRKKARLVHKEGWEALEVGVEIAKYVCLIT
jgi:hypothetical protein